MVIKTQTFDRGHLNLKWNLPPEWEESIANKDWNQLDQIARSELAKGGRLHQILEEYCPIKSLEFIISLRKSPDEEGIWHDDGSRDLAFSLALSPSQFSGKGLSLREKGKPETEYSLGVRPMGTLTLFLTGSSGYEHKTEEVLSGERLVLAGWIN